jgi:putative transposase
MLSVHRSGYYGWLTNKVRPRKAANQLLDIKIVDIFKLNKQRYGAIRITHDLHERGENCGKNRVAKRMQHLGLRAKTKKKFRVTTDPAHQLPIYRNILNRDFNAEKPNQKWVGDITYLWTDEGWMYLAVVIDLYSRAVIGWSMQPTMTTRIICDALTMALWNRGFPRGVLFHSDRGSQYCSYEYQSMLTSFGFISSMSRKGNCWDNAVAESFFHTLKTELTHTEKYGTRENAKQSIFEYLEVYYNRTRRHSSIGLVSPMTYEAQSMKVA